MRVVILGCGRVGSTLAARLTRAGHQVAIIDRDQAAFDKAVQRLGADFAAEPVLGVGIDEEVLRRAGIEEADAFVGVTSGDNTNIVAAQIARHRFNVPKVLARVYDPIRAEAYREAGIETVCTTMINTGIFEDLLLGRPLRNCAEYMASHLEDGADPRPAPGEAAERDRGQR